MTARGHYRKWILGICCLGLLVIFAGCMKTRTIVVASKSNNLRNVDCKKHDAGYPGHTEILVDATNGISLEDEAVFVCTGEMVHWKAGTGVKTVDVSFLNGEWPFKPPFQATLSGDSQNPTPDREVDALPTGYRAKAYKYKIHIVTGTGGTIDLDPHIIPMGN